QAARGPGLPVLPRTVRGRDRSRHGSQPGHRQIHHVARRRRARPHAQGGTVLNDNSASNGGLSWDDARLSDETAAAMRDLASTITEAPPLRLTAAHSRVRVSRQARVSRRWTWGAPVLAAVTVVAVAVALVLVKDTPNGRMPAPTASASSTTPVSPLEVGG